MKYSITVDGVNRRFIAVEGRYDKEDLRFSDQDCLWSWEKAHYWSDRETAIIEGQQLAVLEGFYPERVKVWHRIAST